MTTVRILSVALVAALALLAAGCGGGGSGTISPELVRSADAICKRQREQIGHVRAPTTPAMPTIAGYLARVLPIVEKANADLHALEPPKGREELWRKLLGESDTSLTQLRHMLSAARGRARLVYGVAQNRLATSDQAFLQTAHEIGLVTCATPGT
jgi:hypothetical protein